MVSFCKYCKDITEDEFTSGPVLCGTCQKTKIKAGKENHFQNYFNKKERHNEL